MSSPANIHQYLLQGGVVRSATFLDKVKELLKGFRTPFAKNTAPVATIPPMSKKEQLLSYSVFIALCVVVIASMRYLENQTVRNWNVALFMILITYGYFQVSKTLSVLMFIAFVVFYIYGGSRNNDTKITEHLSLPSIGGKDKEKDTKKEEKGKDKEEKGKGKGKGKKCKSGDDGAACRQKKYDKCVKKCSKKLKDDEKEEEEEDEEDDTEHFFTGRNTIEHFEDPVTVRDVDSGDEEYEEEYEDDEEEEYLEHFESAAKPRTQRQRHRNDDDSDDEEGIEQFGIEDTFMDLHKQIHETFAKHQQHTDNKKAKKA